MSRVRNNNNWTDNVGPPSRGCRRLVMIVCLGSRARVRIAENGNNNNATVA